MSEARRALHGERHDGDHAWCAGARAVGERARCPTRAADVAEGGEERDPERGSRDDGAPEVQAPAPATAGARRRGRVAILEAGDGGRRSWYDRRLVALARVLRAAGIGRRRR